MLDLNLNVESGESTRDSDNKFHYNYPEGSGTTSNSSIVNAEASSSNDDSCSTRAPYTPPDNNIHTFNFDILKVGGGNERENGVALATKELFPGASRSWMDLSFDRPQGNAGGDGEGEVQVMQPPSQQVKKGRRGPRSRSSQYRGVTFYRRTGRWESHIW